MDKPENKSTIEILHPEVWSLAVKISDSGIGYTVHSRMEDNSLIYGNIPFTDKQTSTIKQIESAIYDNRFFLYQYERTDFIIESNHFVFVPDEFSEGSVEKCEKYYRYLYPNDSDIIAVDRLPEVGASIAYAIPSETDSFLRRTFDNPPMMHALTPMIKFFRQKDIYGAEHKMYAFLGSDTVEIVSLKGKKLIYANIFKFNSETDALYYILNAWKTIGLSDNDELQLLGNKELKKSLLNQLRNYIKSVTQTIFPAQLLKLGKNAMSAPLDLIVLPICE